MELEAPYELKKCPSCREKPRLFKNEKQTPNGLSIPYISYQVRCDNPKCVIKPHTYNYTNINNYNNSSIAINKACYNWNSRGGM